MTVIASADQISFLKNGANAKWLADSDLISIELGDDLAVEHVKGGGLIVVQVDPKVPSSMRRIEQLRRSYPDTPQIVALETVDLTLVRTLVRQGVADVVALPLKADELLQVAITVLEKQTDDEAKRTDLARIVAVTRSPGAIGSTTLVTHLAAALAAGGLKVCILDLDIQAGRAANLLGLDARRTLTDLLDAGNRIDAELLKSVTCVHSTGVAVIAAPDEIMPLESLDADQLRRILAHLRRHYDVIILDLPSNLANWTLTVLALATSILMLVEQNLESLRQARRRLDLFKSVGFDSKAVSVVVNRVEKRLFGSISLGDVEQALGQNVLLGLGLDTQGLTLAQDQSLLVHEVKRKSPFASDVEKLANEIRTRLEIGDQS